MTTNYGILPAEEQKPYRERLSSCASTIWAHKVELATAVSSILLITSIVLMVKEGCVHRDHDITNEADDAGRKLRGFGNVESKHVRELIMPPIPTDTDDDTNDGSACYHSDPVIYLFTIGAPSLLITLAFSILKNESNREKLANLSANVTNKVKQLASPLLGGPEAGL